MRIRSYWALCGADGKPFLPLRAAGFALERGYKAARDLGRGAVDVSHLNLVRLGQRMVQTVQEAEWKQIGRMKGNVQALVDAKAFTPKND